MRFLTGVYSYDDDSETAQVTPFQYLSANDQGIITEPWVTAPPRCVITPPQAQAEAPAQSQAEEAAAMPVSPNRIPTQRQLLDKACAPRRG